MPNSSFSAFLTTVFLPENNHMLRAKTKKELPFLPLFDKFISDSKKGRRLQPNGKKLSAGTIANYGYTKLLLEKFCNEKTFELRIRRAKYLNRREADVEKNYWKKFYKRFTDYLYEDLGCYDNYIGQNIKNIKAFFNYLNKDLAMGTGEFHKLFYVRKEEIEIFPLMPEELNFLIYDKSFEDSLSPRMREVKDVFVFGCTVALRVSDLLALKRSSLRKAGGQHYLAVRSIKTATDTMVRLPDYAVGILDRYAKRRTRLLPAFNKVNLNRYIKLLLEQAGFTHEVSYKRERRGRPMAISKKGKGKPVRFCDVASTHTMRRTAITTMLCLGMPEQIVRKISGHAPGTKEFYRYVLWAQSYQDGETEKMFEKLKTKQLKGEGEK
jgi:site-specific recombinase XerD